MDRLETEVDSPAADQPIEIARAQPNSVAQVPKNMEYLPSEPTAICIHPCHYCQNNL